MESSLQKTYTILTPQEVADCLALGAARVIIKWLLDEPLSKAAIGSAEAWLAQYEIASLAEALVARES